MFGIKGEYRDVLSRNGKLLEDRGWRSNTIVADFGLFLAALMKKDFTKQVGLEYLAVGHGSNETNFKNCVKLFFAGKSVGQDPLPIEYNIDDIEWIWAKKIDTVSYLHDQHIQQGVSNELEITISMPPGTPETPNQEPLEFSEFALVGVDEKEGESEGGSVFNVDKLFLVNYVKHGVITKDSKMSLDRTIHLKFPIG